MKRYFHLFALAAVILLAYSCNKDNTTPEPKSKITAKVEFIVIIPDGQEKYVDQSYEYSIDGKETTVTPSQMKDVTASKDYSSIFDDTKNYFALYDIKDGFKIFYHNVGTLNEGQNIKFGKKTFSAKTVSSKVDSLYMLDSYRILVGGIGYSSDKTIALGFSSDVLPLICSALSENMNVSYTVKE